MRFTMILSSVVGFLAVALAVPKPENKQDQLSNAITNFAVSLTKHLHHAAKEEENLVFSPANIYFTLSMLHLGSAGTTRNLIAQTLGLPTNDNQVSEVHQNVKEILESIQGRTEYGKTKVNIANAIFIRKGLELQASYVADSRKYYNNEATTVDFENANEAARIINDWGSKATDGRIPKVIDDVDPATLTMLASALYFNGKWDKDFPMHKTKTEKFNTGVRMIDVQMMNEANYVPYVNNTDMKFEAIALDYADQFSMGIILPYPGETLMSLTQSINGEHLQSVFASKSKFVDYKIPRTKFSYSKSLKEALSSLGLSQIFNVADLTNMIKSASSAMKIGDAKHVAEIEIDEEGTKASAITAVSIVPTSAWVPMDKAIPFYVNRPFLLTIWHRFTKTILFVGMVHQPVQNSV